MISTLQTSLRSLFLAFLLPVALIVSGCQSVKGGTALGATIGATVGGAAGLALGGEKGMLAGAAIGAMIGGQKGYELSKQKETQRATEEAIRAQMTADLYASRPIPPLTDNSVMVANPPPAAVELPQPILEVTGLTVANKSSLTGGELLLTIDLRAVGTDSQPLVPPTVSITFGNDQRVLHKQTLAAETTGDITIETAITLPPLLRAGLYTITVEVLPQPGVTPVPETAKKSAPFEAKRS